MSEILDLVAAVLVLTGAFFSFAAAVGIVRFADVLQRMHAVTKPQVFGLLLVLSGVALALRTPQVVLFCIVVFGIQVLTTPVAGHMVARTAYRTGQWDADGAVLDDYSTDLQAAGFTRTDATPAPTDDPVADERHETDLSEDPAAVAQLDDLERTLLEVEEADGNNDHTATTPD